jgi:hypothetical protein
MFFSVPDNDWPGVIARCLTKVTQASVLQSSNDRNKNLLQDLAKSEIRQTEIQPSLRS